MFLKRSHRRSPCGLPRSYPPEESGIIQHQPIPIYRKLNSKLADSIHKTLIVVPTSRRGNLQTGVALLGDFYMHLRDGNVHHAECCSGTWLESKSPDRGVLVKGVAEISTSRHPLSKGNASPLSVVQAHRQIERLA